MNTTNNTSKLVILGLMTGILLLMAYTPLGYLNIGPLAITFNVIPVRSRRSRWDRQAAQRSVQSSA